MDDHTKAAANAFEFDIDALRARYRLERDKRLRSDASGQYREVSGDFARFEEEDPYAEPGFTRDPVDLYVEVVVIGGGFSGMLAAAHLKQAGVTDVKIIEAGGDFGGTWYWNRYPGVQCDIESYCYMPLLEELNYMPTEKYAQGREIFEHSQRIGHAFDLYGSALFQTRVKELRWDEVMQRWRVHTNRGDDIKSCFVVMALGATTRPKLPGIPGIENFRGKTFHTSHWDYGYTGGDADGVLTGLRDKRVAIVGTGATGVQCIPRTARYAQHLYVFQRTPSSVDERGNRPTDPDWVKSLRPGWQKARREHFSDVVAGKPVQEDLVDDGWTDIFRNVAKVPDLGAGATAAQIAGAMELADFQKMNRVRARVDAVVEDPEVAEKLKPYYRQFCKRPTFNDEFLQAFNRKNVTLVDTSTQKGVERITEGGVVANGIEHEVDCIIFATGFDINASFRRRTGFDIFGRSGLSIQDYYKDGFRTFHGHSSRGFPNWFFVGTSQNAVSVNITAMLEDQTRHVAYIVKEVISRGASTVEPTLEAEEAWIDVMRTMSKSGGGGSFQKECTPGYYNNEGRSGQPKNGGLYTGSINEFNALLGAWRDRSDLQGLDLRGVAGDRVPSVRGKEA